MLFSAPIVMAAGLVVSTSTPMAVAASKAVVHTASQPSGRGCPVGATLVQPSQPVRTPHGGTRYTFHIPGQSLEEVVPPANWHPATVPTSELAEMNFLKPANQSETLWRQGLSAYRGFELSPLCVTQFASKRGAVAPMTHVAYTNWSGYINTSNTYDKVVSHWTQTSAHTCNCTGPTDEVTWVGIGGVNGGLIQAGTRMYSANQPTSWFEYISPSGQGIEISTVGTVGIGSDIAASVAWGSDHSTAYFALTENGTYKFNMPKSGLGAYYDPSTAEYIVERPSCGNDCYRPLGNFVQTNFFGARAYVGSTAYPFTSLPFTGAELSTNGVFYSPAACSTSSTILSYPENASGQNFDIKWCRAS